MPETSPEASTQPRGQRLWAVLLVLDSFFVITFGGTLAMKAYQHWLAPAEAPAPRRGHKPPKTPAAKPAEPEAPAKAPEPVALKGTPSPRSAEPAESPAPKASNPAEAGLRPPKPSMLHEAPARERAAPQTAGTKTAAPQAAAPAAATPGAAAPKAVPTDFAIKAPGAKSVELAGAFLVRGGGKKAMVGHPDGSWTVTLYLTPNTYRYWFLVNGKKQLDPQATAVDRGASVRTVGP